MPASFLSLFPNTLNFLETIKVPLGISASLAECQLNSFALGSHLVKNANDLFKQLDQIYSPLLFPSNSGDLKSLFGLYGETFDRLFLVFEEWGRFCLNQTVQRRRGEYEFLNFFTQKIPSQHWTFEYDRSKILLDLPSLRLLEVSAPVRHKIQNVAVVFAPRAGHHSNIAERVALFLRDQGLSRMTIVEQKCAEEIPLAIQGKRHFDRFEGQVEQYRRILEFCKNLTGYPPHLIAICQPGPLLISTLILNPELGRTFGSAGSPMHTEAERGFITDFARLMGEDFIERLIQFFGRTVPENEPGAGRETFDGRFQVLGFYLLGLDQHSKNLKNLLSDLRWGKEEASHRQKTFYDWYNYVYHFPVGFIRDTFKKIFIHNQLVKGTLEIGGKGVILKDYPASVPIWALGGLQDEIAPPKQAIGHLDLIDSVPPGDKLSLTCNGGHMALFRSQQILRNEYRQILDFILKRSDYR